MYTDFEVYHKTLLGSKRTLSAAEKTMKDHAALNGDVISEGFPGLRYDSYAVADTDLISYSIERSNLHYGPDNYQVYLIIWVPAA